MSSPAIIARKLTPHLPGKTNRPRWMPCLVAAGMALCIAASAEPAGPPRAQLQNKLKRIHSADHRDDRASRAIPGHVRITEPVMAMPGARLPSRSILTTAAAGGGCTFDLQCDDGDPCTTEICDIMPGGPAGSGTCDYDLVADGNTGQCATLDGNFCNGREICTGHGRCNATTHLCEGSGATGACTSNADCTGKCDAGTCVGGPNAGQSCKTSMQCRNVAATCGPPPAAEQPSNYCTTVACVNGRCLGGPDQGKQCAVVGNCGAFTNGVCDEYRDQCAEACVDDADCNTRDGLLCNGAETCDNDHVCVPGTNPCGPGALCLEGVCTGTLLPCSRDSDCASGQTCSLPGPGCYEGRCCFTNVTQPATCANNADCPSGRCDTVTSTCSECVNDYRRTSAQGPSQDPADQCEEKGGLWYATDTGKPDLGVGTTCPYPGHHCPQYSSGIAPFGDFPVTIGPVSASPVAVSPPNGPGAPFSSIGDDYDTGKAGVVYLETLRWVGRGEEFGFVQFEFYDRQGRFVGAGRTLVFGRPQPVVQQVPFDPPLLIPAAGFVVARAAADESPNLRLYWASTDAVDVGSNDPDVLVHNDCQRDCDSSDCTNFLAPRPGVLAFEMVVSPVDPVDEPRAACCRGGVDQCDDYVLPWECLDGVCVGGTNDCRPCSEPADCPEGTCQTGVLQDVGYPCRWCEVESADPFGPCTGDADCRNATYPNAECIGACETGACCLPDGACVDGMTDTECAATSGDFLGFGTDCLPDCCARPVSSYTGADDCQDTIIHALTVPQFNVCLGGTRDGQSCTTVLDCPSGTGCMRRRVVTITGNNSGATATSVEPDSCYGAVDSPTEDRGWWEAFTLDDCAFVRLDFCCSDSAVQHAYRWLYDSCPCSAPVYGVSSNPFPSPFPESEPFCNGREDVAAWFGPLLPGAYYYPIPSSQLSPGGQYQLHITVDACPKAACCNGSDCSIANIFDCDGGGGFYLGPPNRSGLESTCVPNSPDCDPSDGTNCGTCQVGSCCSTLAGGPGSCKDQSGTERITETTCNAAGGTFTGGVRCQGGICANNANRSCSSPDDCSLEADCLGDAEQLAQPTPCRLCPIESPVNCHERTGRAAEFDISELTLAELTVADDFIPLASEISRICTSGVYISTIPDDFDYTTGCRQRTLYPMPNPVDKFRVRIYADGADDANPNTPPYLPGDVLADRYASSTGNEWFPEFPRVEGTVGRMTDLQGPNTLLFGADDLTDEDYFIDLSDDPITGLQLDGRRYWIEIMNNMDESPAYAGEPSCIWFINHAETGNDYAAPGAAGVFPGAAPFDLTVCVDSGFTDPAQPTGACCLCGTCTDDTTVATCETDNGVWFQDEDCSTILASGECVSPPTNDECTGAVDITGFGDPTSETVTIQTNHFCATTSLPDVTLCSDFSPPYACETQCGDPHGDWIGNDLWFKYVAPEEGELLINMCQTGIVWDSMFAIYQGPIGTGECPCPIDVASCETLAFPGADGATANDEGCGFVNGPGITQRYLQRGTCYLIQVGSWGLTPTTPGIGYISFAYEPVIIEPFPIICNNDFELATDGAGGERLSRFGCISSAYVPVGPGGAPPFAFKIRLKTLYNTTPADPDGLDVCPAGRTAPSMDPYEGAFRYLGPPVLAVDESVPPAPDYIVAPLVCTPEQAAIRDWSRDALAADFPTAYPYQVYFFGAEVVPCSFYDVYACVDLADDSSCSAPPSFVVTGKLGDVWPPFRGVAQPSFVDINALVGKYKGIGFQPGPTPHGAPPEWHALLRRNVVADYDVTTQGRLVNFEDISIAVDAYKGLPYNLPGPAPCSP